MKTVVRTHSKKDKAPKLQSCYCRERLEYARKEADDASKQCTHAMVMDLEYASHLEARYAEYIKQLCKEEMLDSVAVQFTNAVKDIYDLRDRMLVLARKALKTKDKDKRNSYLANSYNLFGEISDIRESYQKVYNSLSKVGGLE